MHRKLFRNTHGRVHAVEGRDVHARTSELVIITLFNRRIPPGNVVIPRRVSSSATTRLGIQNGKEHGA